MNGSPDPKEIFREEARELLDELEAALIGLENNPADLAMIDTAFRALHTIKGSGTMFDFAELVAFAHELESTFVTIRDEKRTVDQQIIDLTLAARDHLRALIDGREISEEQRSAAGAVVAELQRSIGKPPKSADAEEHAPDNSGGDRANATAGTVQLYRVEYRPSRQTFVNGTNPLALIQELRELGDVLVVGYTGGIPTLGAFEPDVCYLAWDFLLTTTDSPQAIEDVFMFVDEESRLEIQAVEGGEYRRLGEILVDRGVLSQQELEKLLTDRPPLGEILVNQGVVSEDSVRSALEEQKWSSGSARAADTSTTTAPETVSSIKVRTDRLDHLVNLVGELVSLQAQITLRATMVGDRELSAHAEQLERLVRESRELSMELHMVPVETLFSPFRRLVRDLAKELGREVRLEMTGTETELDKNVVESLRDPLLHIVRNSIDHGIEPPDVREARGKPRAGHLTLRASYTGALVSIRVEDDGGGIQTEKVLKRAYERGIVEEGASLSHAQILDLVFAPGFSTAEAATQVSGRGVGMDVVRRNVESLNGAVTLTSEEGGGTVVELRIPLTLAIVEGLLAEVGDQFFLINLAYIRECIDGTAIAQTRGQNMFDFRGQIVPVIDLAEHFGIGVAQPENPIVVVQAGDTIVGLAVSALHENHQSVVKSLGKMFSQIDGLSGAVFLGDGTPALMLDIERIVRTARDLHGE
ncbi:MAG: chemotaxis protein CheA [Spirochaeta sp.]|jgi:two-component system chemotaxis sensor kinase CheA|nr:chemotaxis protein CheA [Spirochaeta sp.]